MNKSHRVHGFAFNIQAIKRLESQITAGHDLLWSLAMILSISFYGIFVSIDAHFACMDGVRLGFLSLLQFLEHWLVHNSSLSFSY